MSAEASPRVWPMLLLTAVFVGMMLAVSAYGWVLLPEGARVATHWGLDGQPNGYSSKGVALLIMPLMAGVLIPLMTLLVRLDPRREHVAQSQGFLLATMSGLLVLFSGLHVAMLLTALGHRVPMNSVVLTLIGGLFLVVGTYMRKVRSNFFMGVRTPWTLSSELSWEKTHRLAGRLFVVAGLVSMAAAWLLPPALGMTLMIASILAASVLPIGYSYVVWKGDPERKDA